MAEKVKEVVLEDIRKVEKDTLQAARSGAYLYPVRGIVYFVSHKSLWKPMVSKLTPSLTLGLGITVGMFLFTYVPQMAVMAFTQGPLAAVSAALLVLSESSTLFTVLSKAFLIEESLVDTFDGTLVARDQTALVSKGRDLRSGTGDPIAKLGKLLKSPFAKVSPKALIRYVLHLPLNFIPVIGTVIFVILQGRKSGPNAHARYFQLKEWNSTRRDRFVAANQGAYTGFGVVAVLLEMVPLASILFAFTNTVGAALWAADMEKGATGQAGDDPKDTTAPELREMAKKAE